MDSAAERRIRHLGPEMHVVLNRVTILFNIEPKMPTTEVLINSPEPPRLLPLKRKRRAPSAAPQLASPETPELATASAASKRKRRKKRQPLYLQPEEVERFFRVIDNTRDRALFRLMYHA